MTTDYSRSNSKEPCSCRCGCSEQTVEAQLWEFDNEGTYSMETLLYCEECVAEYKRFNIEHGFWISQEQLDALRSMRDAPEGVQMQGRLHENRSQAG